MIHNNDLLVEILVWLPAISLTRFKSVSKQWFFLISSDEFCRLHTIRNPKPQPSLILRTHDSQFLYFHPILNPHKLIPYSFTNISNPKILSSCNGLILLRSDDQPNKNFFVHNPTTKQSRKISLGSNDKYTDVLGLNLAFDPPRSLHYKVVCVRATKRLYNVRERACRIEVYSSESCSWYPCLEAFTAYTAEFESGVHWNNTIHWKSLYFNLDKNVIGKLPRAKISWRRGGAGGAASSCQLQESKGYLHHFIIVSYLGDKSIAVYEMQKDYSKWVMKYDDGFGRLPGMSRILTFVRGEDGETCTIVTHVPGKITSYRFLGKSFEELVDLTKLPFYQDNSLQFDSKDVYHFGETFAPV